MHLRGMAYLLASTALLGVVAQDVAWAQDVDPNTPVTNRPRPDYDPLGIRAGSYFIFPEVGLGMVYDDNIFADADNEIDDFIGTVTPVINFDSNFPRHALDFTIGAELGFYVDNDDLDYQDVFISGSGAYEVTRDDGFGVDFLFGRFHDDFEDVNSADVGEDQAYYQYGGTIDYTQTFNRLNFTPFFSGERQEFEDSFNEDRNDTTYEAGLRAGYFISPRVNVFTQGSYFMIERDEPAADGSSRDSEGFNVGVGTALDFTALLFGEFFIGYEQEMFDNDEFDDEGGVAFDVGLTWNVTSLTTLQLSGGSSIETATQPGAASEFRQRVNLRVDHELLRNVIVGGLVEYQRDDFREIDRTDDTIRAGVDAAYLVNRNFRVEGGYLFSTRSSDVADDEFDRNRVFIALVGML